MPLLTATNISHAFGQRLILDRVSITVEPGQRVGVVGRNGCGKSTLLKILAGMMTPDSGEVMLQRGTRAGYLRQDHAFDPSETLRGIAESAFERLHALHRELDAVFQRMAHAGGDELDRLLKQQSRLETEMEQAGGYAVDHRIDEVLHGLGFTDAQFGVTASGLSGGQKGRAALAKLLLEEPDVLLLDEPTNHLDIDGRLWLERFLTEEFKGAVILISHDRYLLDRVVGSIVEVEQCRLIDYPGNYRAFREMREQRRLTMMRAYENQQDQFRKEKAFILRYKAGQRAKQARGRQSKLDRAIERSTLERPVELETFRLELPKAERTGDIVVSARGLTKQYTSEDGTVKTLFRGFDAQVGRGERWGIIGPNGAGKSTLVRCLLGEEDPDEGKASLGSRVVVGHFKQTHEHLDGTLQVYRYLQNIIMKEAPGQAFSEQQARDLAGAFLLSGEDQDREMGSLSGGERARAVLAGLLASAKNLLVLDEPTNHLDIPSAERLEDALTPGEDDRDGYQGTLILISHDRALIDATCDHLIVLDGKGGATIFLGNYSDWHEKQQAVAKDEARAAAAEKERRERDEARRRKDEEDRRAAARRASKSNPEASRLARMTSDQIEKRIAEIEARTRAIDAEMSSGEVWKDPKKMDRLGDERRRLAEELTPLEMEYFSRGA
ncbi:MAG: ABC-F family ATP-binding cassette domain-containing protein [Phycisphaeraceae bacterium]|nr:MAG: ABC-F family ATP-binding cassette domain-containing protein [Phycisphaeraceae bacterium]